MFSFFFTTYFWTKSYTLNIVITDHSTCFTGKVASQGGTGSGAWLCGESCEEVCFYMFSFPC